MNDLNERLRYLGELARLKWQAERLGLDPLAAALEKLLEQANKKAAPSGRAGQRRREQANRGGLTYD